LVAEGAHPLTHWGERRYEAAFERCTHDEGP